MLPLPPSQGLHGSDGCLFPFTPLSPLFTEDQHAGCRGSEAVRAGVHGSSEAAGQEGKLTEQISKICGGSTAFHHQRGAYRRERERLERIARLGDWNKKHRNELMLLKYIYTDRYWNSMSVCVWCIICSWYVYARKT